MRICLAAFFISAFAYSAAQVETDDANIRLPLQPHAKVLLKQLDRMESKVEADKIRVPLSLEFSIKDKIKNWNVQRERLKKVLYWRLKEQLLKESRKENMSFKGFMSGPYAAELFMKEIKGFDVGKATREEALLENILLEAFADHLREHSNLDPVAWSLGPDEWNDLEIKLDQIPAKVGTIISVR